MSGAALKVCLVLCGHADEEGKVTGYAVDRIAKAADLSKRAVQLAVRTSQNDGF